MNVRMAGAVLAGFVLASGGTARADEWDQIAALQRIKASLTPAERKLDSNLAVDLRTGAASGTTMVDIRGAVSVQRLQSAGAIIRSVGKRVIRATVPVTAVERIAAWPEVKRVETGPAYITATMRRRAAKTELAPRALAAPVVSEGVAAEAVDRARARHRVSGVGVKVCVLSDGVDSLAESQAKGELPDVDVLADQAGGGDEGTAMLEIVHDVAPGASLGFATVDPSVEQFAANIRGLRAAGCDVLVDDVLYFAESPFEDGPIAQAVNEVTADGALYFSSAGNEGNTIDGTSGNYEGGFVDSGRTVGKIAGAAHDFDPGPGVQVFEPLSNYSIGVPVTLWWADQLGRASDDYDLYLFDANGTLKAFSQNVQDGDDDPAELLGTPLSTGMKLAVVRFSGSSRYFQLSALGGRYVDADGLKAFTTPGVTRGHSAAAAAFSVAAAPAGVAYDDDLEPGDPPNPSGPFPGVFTARQLPERFTSDGPRRMFFPTEVVRSKPDITAADGVSTSLGYPFDPFFGTSASAPHAAAIAALVLSGNPGAGEALVREAFDATALDLAPAGVDARTGHGLIRADRALDYTGATPQPLVKAGEPAVTVTSGDGDAYLEPGETATLSLPVTNAGDGTATGVSVAVSSDPAVTPRSRPYGNLAAGATRARPFTVALPDDYPNGKPIDLSVRVSFAGSLSPTTATFRVPTGQPADSPTTFAYAGPPIPIPDASELGASAAIPVDMPGYAAGLTFSVDGTACTTDEGATSVGLDHTFMSDLVGTLTSPSGRTVTLFSADGSGGNNLCQTVFDDTAETPFALALTGDAPFTGSWRPNEPLAPLLDAPVTGTWAFKVVDTVEADTGSIRAVSLHITGYQR
jgi:subtilisin-like proprotein convertase family protein